MWLQYLFFFLIWKRWVVLFAIRYGNVIWFIGLENYMISMLFYTWDKLYINEALKIQDSKRTNPAAQLEEE